MSQLTAADRPGPLILEPEASERFPIVLLTFFLLSLLAHTATFLLFQVVYPQRATLPLSPPEVVVLTPRTPEATALLRRIEADDPALSAGAIPPLPEGIWERPYRPSFDTVRTEPRTVVEAPAGPEFPPAMDPLTFIRMGSAPPRAPAIDLAPQRTRVTFSRPLAARQRTEVLSWSASQPAEQPLEAAQFLIGVSAEGEVRHVFEQRSSGNDRIDREVAAQLAALRFAPGPLPLTWGFVSVVFGDDAYGRNAESRSSTP